MTENKTRSRHLFQHPILVIATLTVIAVLVLTGLWYRLRVVRSESSFRSSTTQVAAQLNSPTRTHSVVPVQVGERTFNLEVANTPESITTGLSGRRTVLGDGMVFVFHPAREATFWMPDMLFDLDIIWVADGKVSEIEYDVPHPMPGTRYSELPRYPSPGKVELVLELPAGTAQANTLAKGDTVTVQLQQ